MQYDILLMTIFLNISAISLQYKEYHTLIFVVISVACSYLRMVNNYCKKRPESIILEPNRDRSTCFV
jgi:hypothetical protein